MPGLIKIAAYAAIAIANYIGIATVVFQYRNPTANSACIFRDFTDVITFQKVERYQLP